MKTPNTEHERIHIVVTMQVDIEKEESTSMKVYFESFFFLLFCSLSVFYFSVSWCTLLLLVLLFALIGRSYYYYFYLWQLWELFVRYEDGKQFENYDRAKKKFASSAEDVADQFVIFAYCSS